MATLNGKPDDPGARTTDIPGELLAGIVRRYGTFRTVLVGHTTDNESVAYGIGAVVERGGPEHSEGELYQGDRAVRFTPYRRAVDYLPCTETDILPPIERPAFIRNTQYWGSIFRFGFFELPEQRIATRATAMELPA